MKRYWIIITIMAMLGLGIAPSTASACHVPRERPFKAQMSGEVTYEFPDSCPSTGCDEFTTIANVTGRATHMGRVSYHSTHHPYDFDNPLDGAFTFTAANGAKLYGVYDYDMLGEGPTVVTFTGGTGRFRHASGTATLEVEVIAQFQEPPCRFEYCFSPDVQWPVPSMTIVGTISY